MRSQNRYRMPDMSEVLTVILHGSKTTVVPSAALVLASTALFLSNTDFVLPLVLTVIALLTHHPRCKIIASPTDNHSKIKQTMMDIFAISTTINNTIPVYKNNFTNEIEQIDALISNALGCANRNLCVINNFCLDTRQRIIHVIKVAKRLNIHALKNTSSEEIHESENKFNELYKQSNTLIQVIGIYENIIKESSAYIKNIISCRTEERHDASSNIIGILKSRLIQSRKNLLVGTNTKSGFLHDSLAGIASPFSGATTIRQNLLHLSRVLEQTLDTLLKTCEIKLILKSKINSHYSDLDETQRRITRFHSSVLHQYDACRCISDSLVMEIKRINDLIGKLDLNLPNYIPGEPHEHQSRRFASF
jgi:hypothetical protein